MKMFIALAIALTGFAAQAEVVGSFRGKDGVTYYAHSDGSVSSNCSGEVDMCPPASYGVPQWLKDFNQYFADQGYTTPQTDSCGTGERFPCEAPEAHIPHWLQKLNDWFKKHGATTPEDNNSGYLGGA